MLLQDDVVGVVKELVLLKKKAYLGRLCVSVLCLLLDHHCVSSSGCGQALLPVLGLEAGWSECSAETLQLLLHFNSLHGQVCSIVIVMVAVIGINCIYGPKLEERVCMHACVGVSAGLRTCEYELVSG